MEKVLEDSLVEQASQAINILFYKFHSIWFKVQVSGLFEVEFVQCD